MSVAELYRPSLTVGDLTAPSGLSTNVAGGISATTDNVSGTGYLRLPETIDASRPFRVSILIEVNDARAFLVRVTGSSNTDTVGATISSATTASVSASVGGTAFLSQYGFTGGVPAGQKFWLNVIGDGSRVFTTICRDGDFGYAPSSTFQEQLSNKVVLNTTAYNAMNFNASAQTWGALNRIYISTASTSSRLIGVYVSHRGIGGPGSAVFAPWGALVRPTILQDANGMISLPPMYGADSVPLVLVHHPNANQGNYGFATGDAAKPVLAALSGGGYVLASAHGCQVSADYTGATASNWGGPTGMVYRKAMYDWCRENLVGLGSTQHLGISMGAQTALAFHRLWPWVGRSIVGISGAVDLSDSFSNRGFASVIRAGYGVWYVCIQAGTGQTPASSPGYWTQIAGFSEAPALEYFRSPYSWRNVYAAGTAYAVNDIVCVATNNSVGSFSPYDPDQVPSLFSGLPIRLWHGSSDSLIPPAQATTLQTALGSNVIVTSVSGGGHIDAAMMAAPLPAEVLARLDLFR